MAGHTCKVIVLHGPVDPAQLRSSIAGRLHRAPELSLRLGEIDGTPWWVPDPQLDVADHVVVADGDAAGDPAGFRSVAGLFPQHLDRSRPLWRIDVHAAAGRGRQRADLAGPPRAGRRHDRHADGQRGAVGRGARRSVTRRPQHRQRGRPGSCPRGRPPSAGWPGCGPPRGRHPSRGCARLSTGTSMPAGRWPSPVPGSTDCSRVAQPTGGATVNDAVLTVVAGGLRRWLEAHHGHLGAVRVKVPVSLHGPPLAPGDAAPSRATATRSSASTCRSAQPTRWTGWLRSATPRGSASRATTPSTWTR